jgi:hypothetical protein
MFPRTGLGLDRYVREPDDVAGARLVMGERVGGRSETIETGLRSVQPRNHSYANLPLERLGLGGMDAPQIRRVMEEGFR